MLRKAETLCLFLMNSGCEPMQFVQPLETANSATCLEETAESCAQPSGLAADSPSHQRSEESESAYAHRPKCVAIFARFRHDESHLAMAGRHHLSQASVSSLGLSKVRTSGQAWLLMCLISGLALECRRWSNTGPRCVSASS